MIPDPKNPNSSPASVVLDILSAKPRLTIKELYTYFQKQYKSGLTLQAFYNLINQMVEQRVLVKEDHLVSIDAAWMYQLMKFSQQLQHTYLGNKATLANILLREGEERTFTFPNPIAADNFWTHAIIVITLHRAETSHKDPDVYAYTEHAWYQLIRTNQERALNEAYEQQRMHVYHVVGSHTFLNTLTPQLVKQDNVHVRIRSLDTFPPNTYIQVIGDFIFETALPKYIHTMVEEYYAAVNTVPDFDAEQLLELMKQPGRTNLTISRKKKRAAKIRAAIAKEFSSSRSGESVRTAKASGYKNPARG